MRRVFSGTSRDGAGNVVSSATVKLFEAGGTTAATFYSSATSTAGITSTTSGSDGSFSIYVDNFDYDAEQTFKITIEKAGYSTKTTDNVRFDDVVLGTYTISADRTVTTHVVIPKGVIYSVASGKTLTFSGPVEAGDYQVFSGAGSVAGLKNITATMFGASPSVTAAVNTAAIQASLNAISTGATWTLPGSGSQYSINDILVVPDLYRNILSFEGQLKQTDDTKAGIQFGMIRTNSTIKGLSVYANTTFDNWGTSRAGILFHGYIENSYIYVDIVKGFEKGIHFDTAGYRICNKFYLGNIRNNKYGLYIEGDGSGFTNFFNANEFYGGYFINDYKTTTSGSTGIYFANGSYYQVSFYSPKFESLHVGIRLDHAYGFNVFSPYVEDIDTLGDFGAVENMTWVHGYSLAGFNSEVFIWRDLYSRRNVFIGTGDYSTDSYPTIITDSSGIGFRDAYDYHTFANVPVFNGNTYKDRYGITQTLNKSYSGAAASAVPASGTFAIGAIAWNTLNPVSGQPIGHICTAAGSMDTLAVTGTATTGSAIIVVSDASGLRPGMYIRIAKDGGGYNFDGYRIDKISGNNVTMTTTAVGDSAAGSVISTHNATWKALPNYP